MKKVSEIEKVINGEVHTRDSIVDKHKGLVHRECHKLKIYAKQVGQEYDDIVSVGFIGLIKAFDKFDGEKYDVRFSTYAVPLVWGEIQRFLRDSGTGVHYPRDIKELSWSIRKNELRGLPVDAIASELDVCRKKVIHALNFLQHGTPSCLDNPVYQSGGRVRIADIIGERDDKTEMLVQDFLESLTQSERIVAEGLMDGESQANIGRVIGASQVQVSRIKRRLAGMYLEYSTI